MAKTRSKKHVYLIGKPILEMKQSQLSTKKKHSTIFLFKTRKFQLIGKNIITYKLNQNNQLICDNKCYYVLRNINLIWNPLGMTNH